MVYGRYDDSYGAGDSFPVHEGYGAPEGVQMSSAGSMGGPKPLTVSQALNHAKSALEGLRMPTIEGEVSELSDKPGYKAVYFTISDGRSALPCLMWNNRYEYCGVRLALGMKVEVTGRFTVYAAKGRMNFDVSNLSLAGEGRLRAEVAAREERLRKAGYMDENLKRPLPALPEKVAVVTSPRGKAVHDCLRTLRRRFPLTEVYVCGVTVEGQQAPSELIRGLEVAEKSGAEVILLVRGGGSYEDLMPFNDEELAKKVRNCVVPVVTGIGHEPDNTICDMVSDRRCSTPTAAAEAVVPDQDEVGTRLDGFGSRMAHALESQARWERARWDRVASRPLFTMPEALLSGRFMGHDILRDRLSRAIPDALANDTKRYEIALARFKGLSSRVVAPHDAQISLAASRLEDLSPLSILSRGYSATYDDEGGIVGSITQVKKDDEITVRVSDGFIDAHVEAVREFARSGNGES